MRYSENDILSAMTDIDPALVDEAGRAVKRRRHSARWAIAACLAALIAVMSFSAGRSAAMIQSKPMLLAVDGKLFKRTADVAAVFYGMLPSSCTKEKAAPEAYEARVETTELAAKPTEKTPLGTDEKGSVQVVIDGVTWQAAVVSADRDGSSGSGMAVITFSAYSQDGRMVFEPTYELYCEGIEPVNTVSVDIVLESPEGGYKAEEGLYSSARLSDVLPRFDISSSLFIWCGGSVRSDEFARAAFNELKRANSISRAEFLDKCRAAGLDGEVIRLDYELFIIRDERGTVFSFNYYKDVGCISVDNCVWFELDEAANELLKAMTGNK